MAIEDLRLQGSSLSDEAGQERRRHLRLQAPGIAPVRVHNGTEGFRGLLLDICAGGAGLIYHPESLGEYDPETSSEGREADLLSPGRRVFLEGFPARAVYRRPTVRSRPPTTGNGSCIQCGFAFERLSASQERELHRLIATSLSNAAENRNPL